MSTTKPSSRQDERDERRMLDLAARILFADNHSDVNLSLVYERDGHAQTVGDLTLTAHHGNRLQLTFNGDLDTLGAISLLAVAMSGRLNINTMQAIDTFDKEADE
ncbi:hypothetical protein [Bifidobacterium primatium]|nr:hypothetical protein [Bifidobacterium primatium]